MAPSRGLAMAILSHCRSRVAPYKRIRRIEFAVLPKTISGKIRRVELRQAEAERRATGVRGTYEFFEDESQVSWGLTTGREKCGLLPALGYCSTVRIYGCRG